MSSQRGVRDSLQSELFLTPRNSARDESTSGAEDSTPFFTSLRTRSDTDGATTYTPQAAEGGQLLPQDGEYEEVDRNTPSADNFGTASGAPHPEDQPLEAQSHEQDVDNTGQDETSLRRECLPESDELLCGDSTEYALESRMHRAHSIEDPLLVLDEDQGASTAPEALRRQLAEARSECKLEMAAMSSALAEVEDERDELRHAYRRALQENAVLSLQLQNHHGIMATDWEQSLATKERLRTEEAEVARLSDENENLRYDNVAKTEEAAQLRQDAGRWQVIHNAQMAKSLEDVSSRELEGTLDAVIPALARLQVEARIRAQRTRHQLATELDLRLCAVCRDEEKCVLFLPCKHVCVCETCRCRLRPYRCPMCQEPIQQHIGRVHY
mmetsp:Transcript_15459/g.35316  ORF Transcript_15459/g.35316 Transcript_15459/m.35316 type:complete len:384 (+) Transcript_15459:104-1255(+)